MVKSVFNAQNTEQLKYKIKSERMKYTLLVLTFVWIRLDYFQIASGFFFSKIIQIWARYAIKVPAKIERKIKISNEEIIHIIFFILFEFSVESASWRAVLIRHYAFA